MEIPAWLNWLESNAALLGGLGLLSLLSLLASIAVLPFLIVRIPEDYFLHTRRAHDYRRDRHPLVHHAIVIFKNGLGAILVLAGILMLVLPGQGLLTILIGLMLMNFPGKYTLEKRVIAQPGVLHAVNWLRARAGHPPLLPPAAGAMAEPAPRD